MRVAVEFIDSMLLLSLDMKTNGRAINSRTEAYRQPLLAMVGRPTKMEKRTNGEQY